MLAHLKEYNQAIRDYDAATRLASSDEEARLLYNDRGLAKAALGHYRDAIRDYDKAIALGCDKLCDTYQDRAGAHVKLKEYTSAIADFSRAIDNALANTVYLMNIEQFRLIYPEYDSVPDNALAEKLRRLYFPDLTPADFAHEFIMSDKKYSSGILPDLYVRRGDAYAALKQMQKADREYDRVSRAFPDWARVVFTIENGRRTRTPGDD
jgi:tetratricopeptide (TPR) repeat protein